MLQDKLIMAPPIPSDPMDQRIKTTLIAEFRSRDSRIVVTQENSEIPLYLCYIPEGDSVKPALQEAARVARDVLLRYWEIAIKGEQ